MEKVLVWLFPSDKCQKKSFQVTRRSQVTWKDFCSDKASKTSYWEVRSHRICIVVNYKHKSYLVIFKKILFRQQKKSMFKIGKSHVHILQNVGKSHVHILQNVGKSHVHILQSYRKSHVHTL